MKKVALALATTLVFSVFAFAGGKKHSVKFFNETEINGTTVKPGEYTVAVDGDTLMVLSGRKEVAKTTVRSEEGSAKFSANSLLYDANQKTLKEIRIGGSTTKFVVGGDASAASAPAKPASGLK